MSLTRHFKETIQARIERDPAFREALHEGEPEAGIPKNRRVG